MTNLNDIPQEIQNTIKSSNGDSHDDVDSPSTHDSRLADDPASDDDVDEMGKEVGIEYADTEPINIEKKVPLITEPEPPVKDQI